MLCVLPGESEILATVWPLAATSFITMLIGARPTSLVKLVPMPKPVSARSANRRRSPAPSGCPARPRHQPLGVRVDAQLLVVRDRLLAPGDRVARVLPQPVEQLGEVQVEVGQEGIHRDHVGERDAQVAAVFLHPALQRGTLEIA